MKKLKKRLGDLLVDAQIITETQLEQALAAQQQSGRKLGRTLIDLALISETQLLKFIARQLDLEFVDISRMRIRPELVQLLPEVHARRYRALVVAGDAHSLTLAVSDPADLAAQDTLEALLAPRTVTQVVATEGQLLDAFDNFYRHTEKIASIAGEMEQSYGDQAEFSLNALAGEGTDSETAVVRLLQSIFEEAVRLRASDIHIEPDEKLLRIRYRVDGQLMETTLSEYRVANALVLRVKLMAELDISEKRLPQDGRFHMVVKGHPIDVRLSTMPVQHGESVVMRLLDQSAGLLKLPQTGMPETLMARVRGQIGRPHGMLLVTGPTGSGKTTTLYALLNELNQAQRKIITVEDPVEYRLPRISQVQVNHKIGLDFAQVLRTTLRQDPDIIMVGEMRDPETVEIGLRSALTGHLVLSTLHTNDAISATLRLIDMGAAPYLVASALRAILAQRLVRRICDHCAVEHPLTPGERAWLAHVGGEALVQHPFKRGQGCQRCNHSGYRGRIGVYELLELDEAMVEALRRSDADGFARAVRASDQFQPLALAALGYARQGVTTLEEAMKLLEGITEQGEALANRLTAPGAAH